MTRETLSEAHLRTFLDGTLAHAVQKVSTEMDYLHEAVLLEAVSKLRAGAALYEALEELEAAILDGLCNSGTPGFDPERLERARASARSALAKTRAPS